MDDYKLPDCIRLIAIVRWLLSIADDKGLTHGEKHHYHMVIDFLLARLLAEMGEQDYASHMDTRPGNVPGERRF